jgi:ribosomal-protein-alanine N-acetyltransferase
MVTQTDLPAPQPRLPHVALRAAAGDDAPLLRRWRAEESVRRHQPLQEVPISQLRAELEGQEVRDLYRGRGERFVWIIEEEGDPCGWITLVVGNWEHGLAELGYALSSAFQGRGVMAAALGLLLPDLFLHTTLERIEARCAVGNVASQRVLEKLGFVREGLLRGYFALHGKRVDHHLYALLRRDFLPGTAEP